MLRRANFNTIRKVCRSWKNLVDTDEFKYFSAIQWLHIPKQIAAIWRTVHIPQAEERIKHQIKLRMPTNAFEEAKKIIESSDTSKREKVLALRNMLTVKPIPNLDNMMVSDINKAIEELFNKLPREIQKQIGCKVWLQYHFRSTMLGGTPIPPKTDGQTQFKLDPRSARCRKVFQEWLKDHPL